MNVEQTLARLVKREGMFTDEASGRRGLAQYVGTFREEETDDRLVLLLNAPFFHLRELRVDRDGNVLLLPDDLGELRVERGRLLAAVDKYNDMGRGQIFDVLVL
jgi:hypothetical protein